MLKAIWEEFTGQKVLRNARTLLPRLEQEQIELRRELPNLSGWDQAVTSAKLEVSVQTLAKLNQWFDDCGYSRGRHLHGAVSQ